MNMRIKTAFAFTFVMACILGRTFAQLSFIVTDLGTLGGNTSTAAGIAGQGTNAAGMVVGSSTTSDNSEHAFLFANGQMLDLTTCAIFPKAISRFLPPPARSTIRA